MSRPGETTTEEHQGDGVPFAGPDTGREGDAPARLAVFDFDGTSIEGNSPVLLVQHLMERGMLRKRVIFRILLWAAAYKLRLPDVYKRQVYGRSGLLRHRPMPRAAIKPGSSSGRVPAAA